MKKKIIVMGLGCMFREYERQIYDRYDVVGVTSNNQEEAEYFPNYIPIFEINQCNYDYIMICSVSEIEIINQLVDELHVAKDKILLATVVLGSRGARGLFHSQYNEDASILLLLNLIGIKENKVTYLELGTNHPIKRNNTYSLYLLGASGILVEPNRNLKNLIEIVRPRDILVNKAVSLDGKPAKFYDFNASVLSTLAYDKLDTNIVEKYEDFILKEIYMVETVTINELIHSMDKTPDVLSIDIEGYDYDILGQIDYEKCRPIIIIAETGAWGVKEQKGNEIEKLLCDNHYLLFCENSVNAIFVDKKYVEKIKGYMA